MSDKHDDAVRLLTLLVKQREAIEKSRHLKYLISKKNLVEYESGIFSQKDSQVLLKHAKRFLDWAVEILPE